MFNTNTVTHPRTSQSRASCQQLENAIIALTEGGAVYVSALELLLPSFEVEVDDGAAGALAAAPALVSVPSSQVSSN